MNYQQFVNPQRKWYNNKRLVQLHGIVAILMLSATMCGYDNTMMNGVQSLPQWSTYFDSPSGRRLGLLIATLSIGALVSYPIAPYATDGLGRRYTILLGALLILCGSALQTFARSLAMFMGARFLIGFGMSFNINAAPILLTELAYPPYRSQLTSTYNALWYSGSIIAAWATLGTYHISNTWAWRVPAALQGLLALIQILLVWVVPESPRWLISRQQEDKALKILAMYHADGDKEDPLVVYEIQCIKEALITEKLNSSSYIAFFKTPGNLRRLRMVIALAAFSQWSGMALPAFYLNIILTEIGIIDPQTQLIINALLSLWNVAFSLIGASLVERVGRRRLFLSGISLLFVFFAADTACFAVFSETDGQNKAAARAFVGLLFISYAAFNMSFVPLMMSYAIEILPFSLRAKGLSVWNITLTATTVFNSYANPIALEAIGWKYFAIFTGCIGLEAIFFYKYMLETKNLSLEETAALFDAGTVTSTHEHFSEADSNKNN